QNNLRSSIAAGKALVPIIESKWHKLSYILCNFETILEHRKRVKPNNSPVFLYPNGKIRIPVMGTYTTINEAYKALKRLNGDTSQE
ncbi:hypothetical protein M3M33_15385, partial [Loigolactobacillus coryniformis]|uniref:hypothetical protein n=1 Tax=Loigolactobacillus coryniformis TaxID=1610 RepID=UPI00201ACADD